MHYFFRTLAICLVCTIFLVEHYPVVANEAASVLSSTNKHQGHNAQPADGKSDFERRDALAISQAAIGKAVGDYHFYDTQGERVNLAAYLGKPLVISLIYTSCYHICPSTTKFLEKAVNKAESALGNNSFNVVTIGFDTPNDSADKMRHFARQQKIDRPNWQFLATDADTITALTETLGFQYFPSPQGFDHLIQNTIVDREGIVYRQVYGIEFEIPHFIGPLKDLVFGDRPAQSLYQEISNRVRLFCTVYDPASDTYRFDYSIFVGLVMGLSIGGLLVFLWIKEWRYSKKAGKT